MYISIPFINNAVMEPYESIRLHIICVYKYNYMCHNEKYIEIGDYYGMGI